MQFKRIYFYKLDKINQSIMKTETDLTNTNVNMARRSFLRYAGAGVAGIGYTISCSHAIKTITLLQQQV